VPTTVSSVLRALKPSSVWLVIALLLGACSATEPVRDPDTVAVGVGEPASLNPGLVTDLPGRMITGVLWTPLVTYDADKQQVTPLAAAAVTSQDQVVWTIRLRPGMRFHDGTPVTAASYVDTWQNLMAQHWPGATVLTDVLRAKDLRAVDDTTISLTLSHPFGATPLVLGSVALLPLPSSVLTSHDWSGFATHPIGNGPYRMADGWQHGARLTRADTYQGPNPGHARVIDLKVLDPGAQYAGVRSGSIDLATAVPGSSHDAMLRDFADRHLTWPLPSLTYLTFPLSDKRFADPVIRHAVALAVDRSAMEAGPLDHQIDVARSLLPPYTTLAQRPGPCRPCNADPAAAKALLDQSGALTGPVALYADPPPVASALADQLHRALGLAVTAWPPAPGKPADGPTLITRPLFTPSPREPMTNLPGYSSPAFEDVLSAADAATTPEESGQLYRFAENQILRDLPVVPLWSAHGHAAWGSRISNLRVDPYRDLELDLVDVHG
jgi:oligopeptide transport system substrate-binding protein